MTKVVIFRLLINSVNVMGPTWAAYLYDIIRNEEKSEGFDCYIVLIISISMIHFILLPPGWRYYDKYVHLEALKAA